MSKRAGKNSGKERSRTSKRAVAEGAAPVFTVSDAEADARSHRLVPSVEGALAPLFVHSSFRTCSTWLWTKLRAQPTTKYFYNNFNEEI